MALNTQTRGPAFFQVHGYDEFYIRQTVTIASGADLEAGTIVGQIAHEVGSVIPVADEGNTGDGVLTVAAGSGAKVGTYTLTVLTAASNGGQFMLQDPDGLVVGLGNVAAELVAGGLTLTLADGDADFAAGDTFAIPVAAGSLKWEALDPAGTDGTEIAAGILVGQALAADGDVTAEVIVRGPCAVRSASLTYPTDIDTDGEKAPYLAQLKALGILAK